MVSEGSGFVFLFPLAQRRYTRCGGEFATEELFGMRLKGFCCSAGRCRRGFVEDGVVRITIFTDIGGVWQLERESERVRFFPQVSLSVCMRRSEFCPLRKGERRQPLLSKIRRR